MCDLCSSGEAVAKMARKGHEMVADDLRRLAKMYDDLATIRINPHSEDAKDVGLLARRMVRHLVDDWV